MQKIFLIDVNLPRFFSLWNTVEYIHQYDLGDEWSDTEIWKFAESENLTIITKDSDFSSRILLHNPPPKVIHIKVGNMKMKQFHEILNKLWPQVIELNKDFKLINVFSDRIEGVK
ncbi:putative nuclease of putative toxin-antitoxin system [Pedobacter sp. W3I1]|uniref:DUF5615 family PIN-like protein n=1 Tax=Pedobacter sp. W3I1 TaxID=3042291 RepID=UPI002780D3F1|nr:DUF5615 family PIN-like protein [Pedobacter sp. W3I1]MDQ0637257.1 putative nuclease of putative toxin-antitoxin system [Pedobacter sp. W3I1]